MPRAMLPLRWPLVAVALLGVVVMALINSGERVFAQSTPVVMTAYPTVSPSQVALGDTFTVTFYLRNQTRSSQSIDLGVSIECGGVVHDGIVDGRVTTIARGASQTTTRMFRVPSNAQTGQCKVWYASYDSNGVPIEYRLKTSPVFVTVISKASTTTQGQPRSSQPAPSTSSSTNWEVVAQASVDFTHCLAASASLPQGVACSDLVERGLLWVYAVTQAVIIDPLDTLTGIKNAVICSGTDIGSLEVIDGDLEFVPVKCDELWLVVDGVSFVFGGTLKVGVKAVQGLGKVVAFSKRQIVAAADGVFTTIKNVADDVLGLFGLGSKTSKTVRVAVIKTIDDQLADLAATLGADGVSAQMQKRVKNYATNVPPEGATALKKVVDRASKVTTSSVRTGARWEILAGANGWFKGLQYVIPQFKMITPLRTPRTIDHLTVTKLRTYVSEVKPWHNASAGVSKRWLDELFDDLSTLVVAGDHGQITGVILTLRPSDVPETIDAIIKSIDTRMFNHPHIVRFQVFVQRGDGGAAWRASISPTGTTYK